MINKLLKDLEFEAREISIASSYRLAIKIAMSLPSFQPILDWCAQNPRDSICVLEILEDVIARPIDEDFANPNDEFAFVLMILLKEMGMDNNGKFAIALDAIQKMKNCFWATKVRHDNFLEGLIELKDRGSSYYSAVCDIPEFLGRREFEKVNEILVNLNLSEIPTYVMYGVLFVCHDYMNQLPHYLSFWERVRQAFIDRKNDPNEDEYQRTDEQINRLLEKFKNVDKDRVYDPEKPRPEYKLPEDLHSEIIEKKLAWAKEIGDKELEDIITYYQIMRSEKHLKRKEFDHFENRYGEKIMREKIIEALRAYADILEEGKFYITYCKLPKLPLAKNNEFISEISVHVMRYLPGG